MVQFIWILLSFSWLWLYSPLLKNICFLTKLRDSPLPLSTRSFSSPPHALSKTAPNTWSKSTEVWGWPETAKREGYPDVLFSTTTTWKYTCLKTCNKWVVVKYYFILNTEVYMIISFQNYSFVTLVFKPIKKLSSNIT